MLNSWKEWIERAQDLGFTEVATPARSATAEGSQSHATLRKPNMYPSPKMLSQNSE